MSTQSTHGADPPRPSPSPPSSSSSMSAIDIETWLPSDVNEDGDILRVDVFKAVDVDPSTDLFSLSNGVKTSVRFARPRFVPDPPPPLPVYVERESLVEVNFEGGENDDLQKRSSPNSAASSSTWFLARVIGFRQRDVLLVSYLIDEGVEYVKKSRVRYPNGARSFRSAGDVLKLYPALGGRGVTHGEKGEKEKKKKVVDVVVTENNNNNAKGHFVETAAQTSATAAAMKTFLDGEEEKLARDLETLSTRYVTKEAEVESSLKSVMASLDLKCQEKMELERRLQLVSEELRNLQRSHIELENAFQLEDRIQEQILRWAKNRTKEIGRSRSEFVSLDIFKEAAEACSICMRSIGPQGGSNEDGGGEFVFACARGHSYCGQCHSQSPSCAICSIRMAWNHPICLYFPPMPVNVAAPGPQSQPPPPMPPQQQPPQPLMPLPSGMFSAHPPMHFNQQQQQQAAMRFFFLPQQFQQQNNH